MSFQKFSNRSLDGLGGEYGIVGSVSRTDAIDISPPVLVHDVSENARAMAWLPILVDMTLTVAASTAGFALRTRAVFLAQANAVAAMEQLRLAPGEVDLWVAGVHASSSAALSANVATAAIGARMGQGYDTSVGLSTDVWLSIYDGSLTQGLVSGGAVPLKQVADWRPAIRLPFLLADFGPSGFLARLESNAGIGGAVCPLMVLCLLGPKGSIPPGT